MSRPRFRAFLLIAAAVAAGGLASTRAHAQVQSGPPPPVAPGSKPRPRIKGRAFKIKVDSAPPGAAVFWDAGPTPAPRDYAIAGYTPLTIVVPGGPVRLAVELKGYRPQERDLDVNHPEDILVTMERATSPARLELVAGGDGGAAGAEVSIDGVVRGTIPSTFEVAAGRRHVEVKKEGWKAQARWVELGDDERRTIDIALERAEPPTGTLLVTSDGPGDVYVDGVRKDAAPAVIGGLPPGQHVVEVRRDGVPPWRQTVAIVAGQQAKLVATLAPAPVAAPAAPATVAPPSEPAAAVEPPRLARLRLVSTPRGADVAIDGVLVGKAPIERGDVTAGDHLVTFYLEGYADERQTISVVGGADRLVSADLRPLGGGLSPEQLEKRKAGMSSFGARTLPTGAFTADLGLGYPYILFARLTLGVLTTRSLGLDLGIEMQSFFQMWTGALHARLQLLEVGPLSLGVRGNGGGGLGSNGKNTMFFDLAGLATLDFAGVVSFSVDVKLSTWSDRLCPSTEQAKNGVGADAFCAEYVRNPSIFTELGGVDPTQNRLSGARLYTGLTLVAAIDQRTSFFARLEFIPGANVFVFPKQRPAFLDRYNSVMQTTDPFYYPTIGFELKY
jgi:hypothetical protein